MNNYTNPVTVTGNPASFEASGNGKLLSLSVPFSPIQDLHGYDNPWIGTDYDQQPYNFRAVSSSSVSPLGNSEMGNIVGGTVAWNQLVGELVSYTADASGVTVTYNTTTHELTLNGTTTARVTFATYRFPIGSYIAGHVYLFCNGYTTLHPNGAWDIYSDNNKYYSLMKASQSGTNVGLTLEATSSGKTYNNVRFVPQLFDLTAMFGSTIADYIYSLEQADAGAGVAWFRNLFPKPYYAYDAGSLQSVNTSAHKTYKADNTLLGNYALDSSLTLRGIPKLDANNNLYYDGDSYAPDGTVTRKFGIVDLGTLNWYYNSTFSVMTSYGIASLVGDGAKILCSKYETITDVRQDALAAYDKAIGCNKSSTLTAGNFAIGVLVVKDTAYTDAETFKTAMSGVYLVYELATPTTETAIAYAATQSIDPDGTEEYVDYAESQGTRDVAIPVGHYTNYANICPISGRTGVSVYVSPTQDQQDATTYAVDWTSEAGTVYHGTVDPVTGQLTVDWASISSYAGETLPGAWISDRDVYAPGASPTTGAQVVYELATPLTYQLTPTQVELLIGQNNVWSDSNESVTLTYVIKLFTRYTFKVNNNDYSQFVERDSYVTELTPVFCETIKTMDGVNHTALLRLRGSITVGLNPQTKANTAAICADILQSPVEVQYHCLQRNANVTALMVADTISAQFLSRCLANGDDWNKIEEITLTEL